MTYADLSTDEFVSAVVHRTEAADLSDGDAMTAIMEWVYGNWGTALKIAGMAPDTAPPTPIRPVMFQIHRHGPTS